VSGTLEAHPDTAAAAGRTARPNVTTGWGEKNTYVHTVVLKKTKKFRIYIRQRSGV